MLNANIECISGQSSAAGSMTTHAETVIFSPYIRRRPFERPMRAFPRPMNETMSNSYHPQVLLNAWEDDDYYSGSRKTAERVASVKKEPTAVVSKDKVSS